MAAHVADSGERGCPLVNAAVEPPEKSQPARRVIEEYKTAQWPGGSRFAVRPG
jgi:hypothetical protein